MKINLIILLFINNSLFSQWTKIKEFEHDHCLKSILFVNSSTGFVISDNLILRTENAGDSWMSDTTIHGFFKNIDFITPDSGVICCDPVIGGDILNTYNSGLNWLNNLNDEEESIVGIEMVSGGKIYALLGSLTGLPHVISADNHFNLYLYDTYFGMGIPQDIYFTSPDTGFVCGMLVNDIYSTVYKTTNGGQSWFTDESKYGPVYEIYFPSPKVGYGLGMDNRIWKTIDYGDSWFLLLTDYPENSNYAYLHFVNDTIGYVFRSITVYEPVYEIKYEILRTIDGGLTWITTDFPDDFLGFSGINCVNADTCFALTCNAIYKTTNGGGISTGIETEYLNAFPFSIYPNPSKNYIELHFPKTEKILSIETYNYLGQKVLVSFDENLIADIANIERGIYITEIKTESGEGVAKWVRN